MDPPESADTDPQSTQAVEHARQKNASEINAQISRSAHQFTEPFPIVADQFVEVQTAKLEPYFKSLRQSFIQAADSDADSVISEERFILLCRYLITSRVSRVFKIFCGKDEDTSLIPRDLALPDSFTDKINRIGVVTVQAGAYRVCPKPEPNPVDPDPREFEAALGQFASLVELAKTRGGFTTTSGLTSSIQGSSWWFLAARSVVKPNIIVANESDDVIVSACHKEWTMIDALYSATIRNQYDGLLPVEKMLKWSIGGISNPDLMNMTEPKPTAGDQYVEVLTEKMIPYFAALRLSLLAPVDQLSPVNTAGNIISENDFTFVCRYLTVYRVTHVYLTFRHERNDRHWAPLTPDPDCALPQKLCDIINGIGVVKVHGGQYRVCPKPEYSPPDTVMRPPPLAWKQFKRLVEFSTRPGFNDTGTISSSINGSSWWLLTARSAVNSDVIASELDTVAVYGSHKEWNKLDGFHCAMVQHQFDGLLPIENTLKWSIGTFDGILDSRKAHRKVLPQTP